MTTLEATPEAPGRPRSRPRPTSRSSAPASPGCAWRSSCARPGWTTSWCSSAATRSAAPGGSTPIRAAAATCPRTCTRSRSRRTPGGRAPTRASRRSRPTCAGSREDFDLGRSIRLGTTVTGAAWDEQDQRWTVHTDRGELRARVLVSAAGALSDPKSPDVEGLERFQGTTFHSAAVGPRLRPERQARGGDRHRRLGDPVRPGDRARRRADARLPAHRAVDHAPHRPADQRRASGGSTGASRCSRGSSAAASTPPASCSCSASSSGRG